MLDHKVVQCNLTEATNVAPANARAYLVLPNGGRGHDRVMVLVRSYNGRWVRKWEDMRRLTNFRVKTLSPGHPLYSSDHIFYPATEELAEVLNEARRRIVAQDLGPGTAPQGG